MLYQGHRLESIYNLSLNDCRHENEGPKTLTMERVCFLLPTESQCYLLWALRFSLLDFQEVAMPDKMSHIKIDDTDLHPFIQPRMKDWAFANTCRIKACLDCRYKSKC